MTWHERPHAYFGDDGDGRRHHRGPWSGSHAFGPPAFFRSRYALPLLIGTIQVVGTLFAADHQPARRPLDVLGVLLLVAGPVALTRRGRWPREVLAFTLAATLTYDLMGYPVGPFFISLVGAFIAVFVLGHRVFGWVMVLLAYAGFMWGEYLVGVDHAPTLGEALGVGAWLIALLAFGEMGRNRRERAIESARVRREESKRRVSEERLRIAQELHDVLAHNISLINVQSGVALHLMDDDPHQARGALVAIKDASNDALSELRSVLDILREGSDRAPRSPAPSLADVDALIDRTRSAGLDLRKEVSGEERRLPANVERAAYRIVQEALTNVTRHSSSSSATISISYSDNELRLQIDDDGPTAAGAIGTGKGIAGMTERAVALGGSLVAMPRSDGGFRVAARLPLRAAGDES